MLCLRILGRSECCDTISELSGLGESTCNSIFHTFIESFVEAFEKEFIKMPEGDDLRFGMNLSCLISKIVMRTYADMGFPGTVGSIDVTHVRWLRCSNKLTNLCTGKEGFPTLAFEVIVDHCRRYETVL